MSEPLVNPKRKASLLGSMADTDIDELLADLTLTKPRTVSVEEAARARVQGVVRGACRRISKVVAR